MDQDAFRVLVESVLHEAVEHTARLDGEDELRVCLDELDLLLLDVVRNRIPGVADVIAAVNPLPIAVPGDFLDRQVPDDARAALLRGSLKSSRRSCVMTSRSSARRFDSSCA